ncbi:MAG: ATP-binding protein [Chloroflexi bacterium]|nr:ATP-binding protein [Chloroflexota bacterium]
MAVSGRRRLGKTTLLIHWAKTSQRPYLYWVGSHFSSNVLLSQFSQQVWQHGNPGRRAPRTFSYETWPQAFEELAAVCQGEQRHVVVLDEFPYAVASEPGLPSALQNAWDQHLKFSNICLVLCGSHIGMMERLLGPDAPLYGRMTGPLRIRPLPFSATTAFFPRYSAEQRVAVYALLGGVPAYLEQFSDTLSLGDNIKQALFRETGLFRTDPDFLIGEQVRDPKNYQAVLAAIAEGARRPADIAVAAGLPSRVSADPYLVQLVEMDYLHRELPVTVPPKQQATSRLSRYVLADNYLRFYFRFVRPNLALLAQGLFDEVWERIAGQLRAFIGMTAFEELCRAWVLTQARAGRLPCAVEQVGAHWDSEAQVDVAAINWREQALLLGEAKWGVDAVGREVVQELIAEKTPKVLKSLPNAGEGWTIHYVFFARSGFTDAAQTLAAQHAARLVDLVMLDRDLR